MAIGSPRAIISIGSVAAAVLGVGFGLADRPDYPAQLGPRYEFHAVASLATIPPRPALPVAVVQG
jgi:hypothetical protein